MAMVQHRWNRCQVETITSRDGPRHSRPSLGPGRQEMNLFIVNDFRIPPGLYQSPPYSASMRTEDVCPRASQRVVLQYDVLWQDKSSSITLKGSACCRPRSPRRRRLVCGFGTRVVRIGEIVQWDEVDDVECAILVMTAPVEGTARTTLFQAWVFGGLSFQL
ncbi:uncharacterized protein ARMOST_02414 [Armillaria ostoyae]|uniref:Uncharacterized protein n=1 Tax=Armillaria ostoyae TaxID=47428 RepID=A0A284QRQ6_ARMOS|nr:uncharacterized protein ARMOST_02414 [Armillaria ostoyae]